MGEGGQAAGTEFGEPGNQRSRKSRGVVPFDQRGSLPNRLRG